MLAILGTIVLLIGGMGFYLFNRLVRARNFMDDAWCKVDDQLELRRELIFGLINIVREYSPNDVQIFENIAKTRRQGSSGGSVKKLAEIENTLSRQFKTLFALAESRPEIKADDQLLKLQKTLANIEEQIRRTARSYNSAVRDYNALVNSPPTNLIADQFSFRKEGFFEIEYVIEITQSQ